MVIRSQYVYSEEPPISEYWTHNWIYTFHLSHLHSPTTPLGFLFFTHTHTPSQPLHHSLLSSTPIHNLLTDYPPFNYVTFWSEAILVFDASNQLHIHFLTSLVIVYSLHYHSFFCLQRWFSFPFFHLLSPHPIVLCCLLYHIWTTFRLQHTTLVTLYSPETNIRMLLVWMMLR